MMCVASSSPCTTATSTDAQPFIRAGAENSMRRKVSFASVNDSVGSSTPPTTGTSSGSGGELSGGSGGSSGSSGSSFSAAGGGGGGGGLKPGGMVRSSTWIAELDAEAPTPRFTRQKAAATPAMASS